MALNLHERFVRQLSGSRAAPLDYLARLLSGKNPDGTTFDPPSSDLVVHLTGEESDLQQPAFSLPSSTVVWKPPDYVFFEDAGAKGDGVTSDNAAIVAAIGKGVAQGRAVRATKGRTYAIGATPMDLTALLSPSSGPEIVLDGATLRVQAAIGASGKGFFYAAGTESSKTFLAQDHAIGSLALTLPTGLGASWARGDVMAVQALNPVYGLSADKNVGYARELHDVLAVSGDVLTLDSPLTFGYTVAQSACFSKIVMPCSPQFHGGTWVNGNPTVWKGYPYSLNRVRNVVIDDTRIVDGGGGVSLVECVGATVQADIDRLPNYADSYGYGIALTGSCRDVEVDARGRACRHVCTTLSLELPYASVPGTTGPDPLSPTGNWFMGGPIGYRVQGIGEGDAQTTAVWDSHPYGYDGTWDVMAIGGIVGLQVRALAQRGRVIARGQVLSGCNMLDTSAGCDMTVDVSGVQAGASSKGVSLDGRNNTVRGRVHDCACPGVVLASGAATPIVHGAEITNNTPYGIQDLGAVSPQIISAFIPKSTSQTVSILNLGATGLAAYCILTGYGSASAGMTGIVGGSRVVMCMSDGGQVSNQLLNLGNAGGGLVWDTSIYRGAFATVRSASTFQSDKGLRLDINVVIAGKTSTQLDAAWVSATGQGAAANGCMMFDQVNKLAAVRLGGAWYPITLGSPV